MEKIYAIRGCYVWQNPPDYYRSFFRNEEDAKENIELLIEEEERKSKENISKGNYCPGEDYSLMSYEINGSIDDSSDKTKIYVIVTNYMLESDEYRFFYNNKEDAYKKWNEIKEKYSWDEEKDGEWEFYNSMAYTLLEVDIACSKKDVSYYSKTEKLEPMIRGKIYTD